MYIMHVCVYVCLRGRNADVDDEYLCRMTSKRINWRRQSGKVALVLNLIVYNVYIIRT